MISVVIPLYNKAAYVRRALDSVLGQSFQDFEVIVVDDGSTDGGGRIIKETADPRVRLVSQQNAGVSAARNRGIELAHRPLIAFLDADDEWFPQFLSSSVRLHDRWPEIVASFSNYERTDADRPALTQDVTSGPLPSYFDFCLRNGAAGMCSIVVLARREAITRAGGFPINRKVGEDLDMWFRLACQGPVAYVPTPLARYYADVGAWKANRFDCDLWGTFADWKHSGRIPKNEAGPAERYAALLRLITVASLCRLGIIQQARELLFALPKQRLWSARRVACLLGAWSPVLPARIWLGLAERVGVNTSWRTCN